MIANSIDVKDTDLPIIHIYDPKKHSVGFRLYEGFEESDNIIRFIRAWRQGEAVPFRKNCPPLYSYFKHP